MNDTEHETPDVADAVLADTEEQDTSEQGGPGREAQRLRAARRAVEAERDAAVADRDVVAQRLARLQTAEAERLAAETLADGSDLWLVGSIQLSDVLDDDGNLDAAAVQAAAERIVADRGPRFGRPRTGAAFDGGAREPVRQAAPGWAEVIKHQVHGGSR